jgi:hypothetical protein
MGGAKGERPLEIPGHGHEAPLAAHLVELAQQKLTEAQHRLDDAEHRFAQGGRMDGRKESWD